MRRQFFPDSFLWAPGAILLAILSLFQSCRFLSFHLLVTDGTTDEEEIECNGEKIAKRSSSIQVPCTCLDLLIDSVTANGKAFGHVQETSMDTGFMRRQLSLSFPLRFLMGAG